MPLLRKINVKYHYHYICVLYNVCEWCHYLYTVCEWSHYEDDSLCPKYSGASILIVCPIVRTVAGKSKHVRYSGPIWDGTSTRKLLFRISLVILISLSIKSVVDCEGPLGSLDS